MRVGQYSVYVANADSHVALSTARGHFLFTEILFSKIHVCLIW